MNTIYRVLIVCNAERASTLAPNVTAVITIKKTKFFFCVCFQRDTFQANKNNLT